MNCASQVIGSTVKALDVPFIPDWRSANGCKDNSFPDLGGPFQLRVDGELLPLVYEYPPNYVEPPPGQFSDILIPIVGDISPFSGQTVELDFVTVSRLGPPNGIDSIFFSPEAIPEPSTWALLCLGGLAFLLKRPHRCPPAP